MTYLRRFSSEFEYFYDAIRNGYGDIDEVESTIYNDDRGGGDFIIRAARKPAAAAAAQEGAVASFMVGEIADR